MCYDRPWGHGNKIGEVYVVEENRLGINNHQPKDKSLALCIEHTGDYFYDYMPIVVDKKGIRAKLNKQFGSYAFRKLSRFRKFSDREFHLLLAGENLSE